MERKMRQLTEEIVVKIENKIEKKQRDNWRTIKQVKIRTNGKEDAIVDRRDCGKNRKKQI